jgi:hypothetical protein
LILFFLTSLEAGEGRFSGYMFGDLYYFLSHHDSTVEHQNGFWFRRIYFTYDYEISKVFFTRLRLEAHSPGDFKTKSKLTPFLKDAYLKVKFAGGNFIFGLSPTPTFKLIEEIWGYRSVEKTPIDLYKFGTSRDFGIALEGKVVNGLIKYHLMVANGAGTSSETNRGKKYMFSLSLNDGRTVFEGYADLEDRGKGEGSRYTLQAFFAHLTKIYRFGLQFSYRVMKDLDAKIPIYSAFLTYNMLTNLTLLTRLDYLGRRNPLGPEISYLPMSANRKTVFLLVGYDIHPNPMVHIIPNVEVVFYRESHTINPATEVYTKEEKATILPRLTFFYKFK